MRRFLRNWLRCPVDGDELIKEARIANLGGTLALIFERGLNHREMVAIERAWAKRPEMPTPPLAETDPAA